MSRILIFLPVYFLAGLVNAHSGRTDARGGHNQYSDGTYHYHNSGTMGSNSSDWSIFTWLIVLFIIYIVGLFIWTYFKEGQDAKTPIPSPRQDDSIPNKTTNASHVRRRGEDSMAAKAFREARSSNTRSRGRDSTASKALKKDSASSQEVSESEDLYYDNTKNQQSANSTKSDSDENDDLFFDNRVKK